jgi:hypothetical protein
LNFVNKRFDGIFVELSNFGSLFCEFPHTMAGTIDETCFSEKLPCPMNLIGKALPTCRIDLIQHFVADAFITPD